LQFLQGLLASYGLSAVPHRTKQPLNFRVPVSDIAFAWAGYMTLHEACHLSAKRNPLFINRSLTGARIGAALL
jgi:hypothetical protein